MINYNILALQSLVPNCIFSWIGEEWGGLEWKDHRPQPTKEAWETERARLITYQPKQDCKDKAKQLLAASDWTQAPDVNLTNKSEFATYREKLRDLVFNPVDNPVWPTEPEEKWG